MSKQVGLYFGSFNPVHTGHLLVANHILNFSALQEIRFVLSPQNPFKEISDLADEILRYEILQLSLNDNPEFNACDIEFSLPRPSYTIQTVRKLLADEPGTEFSVIIGSDNLPDLKDWKDIDTLLALNDFHVYGRRGSEHSLIPGRGKFHFYEAPFIDISATHIRNLVQAKKSIKYLVHAEAEEKIISAYLR